MFSYLSPFIGHVVLSKMKPQTKYFYKVWHLSGMRRAIYKNQWILIYEPMHPPSGKKLMRLALTSFFLHFTLYVFATALLYELLIISEKRQI